MKLHPSVGGRVLALCALACGGCSDEPGLTAPIEREPPGASHPPPISGGTLAVSRDGAWAFASDPDFDRFYIAPLAGDRPVRQVALARDDEPGRVVEDGAGRVHVVLRRAGAVATIDPAAARVVERRAVCPAPRGIAWSEAGDALHVACAGGELVTLPAAGGAPTRTLRLDRDLRDVVPVGDKLWVSRFRSAEVLVVGEAGEVLRRMRPAWGAAGSEAVVAWRMIPYGRGAAMVHQRAGLPRPPSVRPSSSPVYYGPPSPRCSTGMTPAEVTVFMPDAAPVTSAPVDFAVLSVDIAAPPSWAPAAFVVVAAGNTTEGEKLVSLTASERTPGTDCIGHGETTPGARGRFIAVASRPSGGYVAQLREPAALYVPSNDPAVHDRVIPLGTATRGDVGHELFHTATALRVACASCHPEGGDDAHAWLFTNEGRRRTPDLRGGVLGTAPYHWAGNLATMGHLLDEVMVRRMGHPTLRRAEAVALAHWLDSLPLPPRSPSPRAEAAARGAEVFRRADVGCAGCHAGPQGTDNRTVDVGTGAAFQVPSLLGLAGRAPYMHDGCAATLRDRFGSCGGGEAHGHVAHLRAGELDDLVAYLETL